jgi:hypothetical protein
MSGSRVAISASHNQRHCARFRHFSASKAASPEGALRFVIDPLSLTRINRLQQGLRVVTVN